MKNRTPSGQNADFQPRPFDPKHAGRQVQSTRGIARVVRSLFSLLAGLSLLFLIPFYRPGHLDGAAFVPLVVPAGGFGLLTFFWWLVNASRAVASLNRAELASARVGPILFGFLVPLVNFTRPYDLMKALDAAADPNDIAPAITDEGRMTERSYRAPVAQARATTREPAWTRTWWTASVLAIFVIPVIGFAAAWEDLMNRYGEGLGEGEATSYAASVLLVEIVVFIVSAVLTTVVVGQIQGRIEERFRRLRSRVDGA